MVDYFCVAANDGFITDDGMAGNQGMVLNFGMPSNSGVVPNPGTPTDPGILLDTGSSVDDGAFHYTCVRTHVRRFINLGGIGDPAAPIRVTMGEDVAFSKIVETKQ